MSTPWLRYSEILSHSVKALPESIYSPAQKLAWLSKVESLNWAERLAGQEVFERKMGGKCVAFATLNENTLDFLFVSPEYWRQGLATSLIHEVEMAARTKGLQELNVEASLALFPLCLREGFQVIEKEYVAIGDENVPRFKMSKPFLHQRHRSRVLWSTDRLYLREMLPIDAQTCYELNLDPMVLRYTGDVEFASVEASREFLENYDPYKKTGYGRWAMIRKNDGAWIGWCGIKKHEDGKIDLGYRLHQQYWNQGYATEAAKLSMELAKNEFHLDKLILEANQDNLASRRIAEKLGFVEQISPKHAAIHDVLYLKNLCE
ncbi:MAG TPA: hypothetical protein DIW47_00190 [Bacteroidetes bacterium]|nr:hypothetical protein [Bacteroidota bacterium]